MMCAESGLVPILEEQTKLSMRDEQFLQDVK